MIEHCSEIQRLLLDPTVLDVGEQEAINRALVKHIEECPECRSLIGNLVPDPSDPPQPSTIHLPGLSPVELFLVEMTHDAARIASAGQENTFLHPEEGYSFLGNLREGLNWFREKIKVDGFELGQQMAFATKDQDRSLFRETASAGGDLVAALIGSRGDYRVVVESPVGSGVGRNVKVTLAGWNASLTFELTLKPDGDRVVADYALQTLDLESLPGRLVLLPPEWSS